MMEKTRQVAEVFQSLGVDYLFIGKFGAVLFGVASK